MFMFGGFMGVLLMCLVQVNGEQIFEGDILLIDDEYYGIIEYENESCGFLVRSFSLTESLESLSNIELCGNKWDTKYLIKRIEE